MFKQNKKSGFTLLELLIVVIIVSILAAVALPRFTKMTRKARSSEAATAIGAMLTAEALYYQEKDTFGAQGDLLVDLNTINFTYSVTTNGATSATATATGQGTGYTGIIVTGTITSNQSRTISTSI